MEFLGIGLPELALILVIVLIVLGPNDMVNTAKRLARTVRTLTQSEFWRATREAWRMAQDIPNELLRETGLEEAKKDLSKMNGELNKWNQEMNSAGRNPSANRILPPESEQAAQLPAQPEEVAAQPQEAPADPAEPDDIPTTPTSNPLGANQNESPRTNE